MGDSFRKREKSPNAGLEIPNAKECMPFALNITFHQIKLSIFLIQKK